MRYADVCNIYVKTCKAGQRVMKSITVFIEVRLKLKVNREKSAVNRLWKRKFLGFTFSVWDKKNLRVKIAKPSLERVKAKIKAIPNENKWLVNN
ncbi:hypothetical protein [Paenibacillus sp. KS-LC4]|uniref:hypothetical protein n=1 Tax=Paenibacillus sp. KS-LC4 TaxID=2979727 RepID=UPI0030CD82D3